MTNPWNGGVPGDAVDVPVLGLLVTDGPAQLRALLVAMRRRCQPRYAGPGGVDQTAAYLVHGSAERLPTGAVFALWLPAGAVPEQRLVDDARVLLTADVPFAMALDRTHAVEAVPAARLDASPVPPFVRRRLRATRHLELDGVAAFEDGTWSWGWPARPMQDDLADTLCATAASVVATTPGTAARALAWGAPLVTDPATADLIGVIDGVHCMVATGRGGRAGAARELAVDDRLAARISWCGRQHFERWHDLRRVADRVADRLGLPAAPGETAVDRLLVSLGTPATSYVRDRVRRATETLSRLGNGARPR